MQQAKLRRVALRVVGEVRCDDGGLDVLQGRRVGSAGLVERLQRLAQPDARDAARGRGAVEDADRRVPEVRGCGEDDEEEGGGGQVHAGGEGGVDVVDHGRGCGRVDDVVQVADFVVVVREQAEGFVQSREKGWR